MEPGVRSGFHNGPTGERANRRERFLNPVVIPDDFNGTYVAKARDLIVTSGPGAAFAVIAPPGAVAGEIWGIANVAGRWISIVPNTGQGLRMGDANVYSSVAYAVNGIFI